MSGDDDRAAFAAAMRGVKKLRNAPLVPRRQPKPAKRPRASLSTGSAAPVTADGTLRRPSVADRIWRQLRRGKIRPAAELDLHGSNAVAAAAALDEFLGECRARGVQCARIVHGKGRRSGPDGPVLKGIVHDVLARAPDVLAFLPADPRHGGSGATVVLLKR